MVGKKEERKRARWAAGWYTSCKPAVISHMNSATARHNTWPRMSCYHTWHPAVQHGRAELYMSRTRVHKQVLAWAFFFFFSFKLSLQIFFYCAQLTTAHCAQSKQLEHKVDVMSNVAATKTSVEMRAAWWFNSSGDVKHDKHSSSGALFTCITLTAYEKKTPLWNGSSGKQQFNNET